MSLFITKKACQYAKVGDKARIVVVLLDSGSYSTLIDQAMADRLKAKVGQGPISRKVNYVDRQVEVKSSLVSFDLANPEAVFLVVSDRSMNEL